MDLANRLVVIVGLGRSGVAAAGLCLSRGARVVANDAAPIDKLSPEARALEARGVRLVVGGHDHAPWDEADLVVVSPGVPEFAALARAEARGVEVIGEIELGARFAKAPIAAIGGTNGKSTTTSLVAAMLEASGKRVFAGGNLGVPLCEVVGEGHDVLVLEVSSFQTERVSTFRPRVAALLNVSADHLDRHASFEAYVEAKGNVFVRQLPGDVAVVPAGDSACAEQAARGQGRLVTFGKGGDVFVACGAIVDSLRGRRYSLDGFRLEGEHNLANACAAVAITAEMGATPEGIAKALTSFEGLAHRTVFVAEIDGVRFYDDSKGTNVGASVAALVGMREERTVLIAGGRDKLGSYEPLVDALRRKGRALVVLGEAAERIAASAKGAIEVVHASSMNDAVAKAASLAKSGDAVLLSPACSSFDMFRSYADRGDAFVRAVRDLEARRADA